MKQLKIAILHCNQGTSDKLYKVVLYENTSSNSYEVHSEYGRRGAAMKINPVKIYSTVRNAGDDFAHICNSKLKKGYQDITQPSDREARYNDAVLKQLSTQAAVLCAEGSLEREQYNTIKGMLASGDEPSQVLAEEMIKAKNQKLVA